MKSFNDVIESIAWTEDYPKEGVRFIDLSRTFGSKALLDLTAKVVDALCIEKGQIILGVPTRGCTWTTIVANAAKTQALYLSKAGVGTPLPKSVSLCQSGTVYNEKKESQFTVREMDLAVLRSADIVWVADDVCESGQTLATIEKALIDLGCKDVRCLSLVTIVQNENETAVQNENEKEKAEQNRVYPKTLFSVVDYVNRRCFPGKSVFCMAPEQLLTLRSTRKKFGDLPTLHVYGPPSMTSLMLQMVEHKKKFASPVCVIGDISWEKFEGGGMPNIHFQLPTDNVMFIYDASLCDTVQDGVVHALARSCPGHMTVVIPYLPQGTMERVDEEGVLATAHTALHSLCAAMPHTAKGPVTVSIIDLHQTGTRFYVTDRVHYQPIQILHTIANAAIHWDNNTIIAFPDDGAAKRFKHLFKTQTLLVFSKTRQGNERKITLSDKIGPLLIEGSKVVIVDDLTRTGGTLINTAKILKELGAIYVSAAFVHADFDVGRTLSFAKNPLIDAIFCSNSVPQKARALFLAAPDKVTIIDPFNLTPAKTVSAAYTVLASQAQTKLDALQKSEHSCVWTGAILSTVPEQPIGEAQTLKGAQSREEFVHHFFPEAQVISIESGIIEKNKNEWCDCAVVLRSGEVRKNGTTHRGKSVQWGPAVPNDVLQKAKECDCTVGEIYQSEYSLLDKSAWIGHMSRDHQSRTLQIESAILKHGEICE